MGTSDGKNKGRITTKTTKNCSLPGIGMGRVFGMETAERNFGNARLRALMRGSSR